MNGIAVLLHDGFYGCGTGAGRTNRAVLDILARHPPAAPLRVMPVHLNADSPEHDPHWHAATRRVLADRPATVHPIDNGTHGRTRFGGLAHFRTACTASADRLNALEPAEAPRLIVALDAPFHGLAPLLRPSLAARTLLVPRSTGRLHTPDDTGRTTWEHEGFAALADAGGHIAAISTHMRTHLATDYRIPARALVDMPNGLTAAERSHRPTAPPLPPAAQPGFLLSMGRAVAYKGFDDLLDALALLRRRIPIPHLVLCAVTDDPDPSDYQRHLAACINELELDATLLTRFDPAMPGLFTHPALRGVVVASRAEPFGRIPLEAAAAGAAPVVTTTAGGLGETVTDGVTGFTAAPDDPADLARAIGRGLALDPRRRAAMRDAARGAARARDYESSVLAAVQATMARLDQSV